MSFIAENPLTIPKASKAPSAPIQGARGLFAKEDGWYDIDDSGNERKIISEDDLSAEIPEVIDNLTSIDTDKALSANQGKVLNESKADKATTVEGYGITDAYTKTEVDDALSNKADKKTSNGGFRGGSGARAASGGAVGSGASATFGGAVGSGASATYGGAVGDHASTLTGGAVGDHSSATYGGAVGSGASATYGGAVGSGAMTSDGFAGGKSAITRDQDEYPIDAIQLGSGINRNKKSLQVYNYQMMDADGNIPADRLVNAPKTEVIDNLTSTDTDKALSANQGKVLNDKVKDLALTDERLKYYGDKDIIPSDENYFITTSSGETITGLNEAGKTQTELVIPYEIDGIKITTLNSGSNGTSILDGNYDITKVVIPNSVTSIGDYAFSYSPLTLIEIPNSVTSIGNNAFADCYSLTSINIPNSVTSIGDYAFYVCTALTSINIPSGVTSIGRSAFENCNFLTSVTIPNSVTNIGEAAFSYCSSLTSITITNSVTNIGDNAFADCPNLKIYCEQGSYAEVYAKANNIPIVYTEIQADSIPALEDYATKEYVDNAIVLPTAKTAITNPIMVNTIYDLGVQTNLSITLPSGKIGDFIQFDFVSGSTATTLSVTSTNGLIGYDLNPEVNKIYSLYFDWGVAGYDGTTVSYGWRFNYSEYSIGTSHTGGAGE